MAREPAGGTPAPPAGGTQSRPTSTLLTLALFLAVCAVLAVAPLPMWAKPFEIASAEDAEKLAKRVFAKPRMTLVHVEEKLAAGGTDGRDAPEGQGIDEEERELLSTRDARADVEALASKAVAVDAAAAERKRRPVIRVDRKAIIAAQSPKAESFRFHARSVNAPGGTIEDASNLDPFFATLDAIAAGDESARAAVVILGNSLIASDHVTDVVRARLVERFGDAGRGFLLPERLSKVAGRKVRTGQGSAGWNIETFAQDPVPGRKSGPFGFTGSLHDSSVAGERTSWRVDDALRARLFYVEHGGQPAMRLEAKGASGTVVVARVEPVAPSTPAHDEIVDVELPADAKELVLVAEGKGARVYGAALERDRAGVIVDTVGVPAASAKLYTESVDADVFVRQLAQREPALFVAMLGGNEVRSFNYGTQDEASFAKSLSTLLERAKKAAPSAACLVVTPIDAVKATAAGEELITRPEITRVIAVQRQVAKQHGCAVFDLFGAMGGAGSLARFREKGFLSDDLVHPTWKGGDVLGQLFADAMLDAYASTPYPDEPPPVFRRKSARVKAPVYAGLSFPAEERPTIVVKGAEAPPPPKKALAKFFEKLRGLERGEVTRVSIGQLGASHTAGQMWTDRMRQRLGERFGVAGRGFVSVGRTSKRLEAGGVVRTLEGNFDIADGREVVLGGAVGMSGTKVRLEPGAHFEITFCAPKTKPQPFGCGAETPGFIQLAWLYTPDMGTADVAVDGKNIARISPEMRRPESDVQFLKVPIDGESASLEVAVRAPRRARDDDDDSDAKPRSRKAREREREREELAMLEREEGVGPVHLLSVVEERERPGIVLDAVGLPGTTGMTPQRWRQDLLAAEVASRNYDLIITAWGTNEAGIGSLDEETYRHHFERTLDTLMQASPNADCMIVGASDRLDIRGGAWRSAPSHDLVEKVQRDIAADRGCAFFSLRRAMGGAGSMTQWVKDGLGNADHVHFTNEGYASLADLVINDLLAAWAHDAALQAAEAEALASSSEAAVDRRGG